MPDPDAKTSRDDARSLRLGQILNDFLDARARGAAVSESALLSRHPDLADQLRQHLELLGEIRPATDRIEELIVRGVLADEEDFIKTTRRVYRSPGHATRLRAGVLTYDAERD